MKHVNTKLILASNSPRRREILTRFGYEFDIVKSYYKEDYFETFSYENIKKNSLGKALEAAQRISYNAVIIGADTMVILDSVCLLNKPRNFNEAVFMLKRLSGKTHAVVTSISLVQSNSLKNTTQYTKTLVTFRELSQEEIVNYINTKNPLDKAGSYGIQDFLDENTYKNPPDKSFISEIKGDYYNVVGFSPYVFKSMLAHFQKALL